MTSHARTYMVTAMLALPMVTLGCGNDASNEQTSADAGDANDHAPPSNRIAIPSAVRSNLGITFAKAERRRIKDTVRAPGRFEYLPTAAREYRAMLAGRVEVLVEQFEHVEQGTPLYRIDSPAWRDIQQSIAEAESAVVKSKTTLETFGPLLEAHERHEQSLERTAAIWKERVSKLEALREAGGGRMTELTAARSSLATAEAELAHLQEKDAELAAAQAQTEGELNAAEAQLEFSIDTAASLLGSTPESLLALDTGAPTPQPRWRSITTIEVAALAPGIVQQIEVTNGTWVDARSNVLTVVQPEKLRFHASGLQSDLGVLRDGLEATIVPPTPTTTGSAIPMDSTMHGTLMLGLAGDADARTVDLYVTPEQLASWARPGVSAQLEIVTERTATPEISIPLAAVQRDGLMPVIFRRAPDNPNEAIRIDADLGIDDGRWVAVLSGLRDGDEVVLDGGFQLMLATSGTIQKGGHFHSDGTFHAEDD